MTTLEKSNFFLVVPIIPLSPSSVTSIGEAAFEYCSSLTAITVDKNNPNYSNDERGVLFNKDKTQLIQYPIGNTATSYDIPSSVTSIGYNAFDDCSKLTTLTIPESVTSIDRIAFYNCSRLTSITVDENNPNYSSDERGVLFNKDKTQLIQYPVGNTATSYDIPSSVTSIGYGAFDDCSSLTTVTIPSSVTIVDWYAFYHCDSLTDVYYSGTEEQWEDIFIGNYNDSLSNENIHYNYGTTVSVTGVSLNFAGKTASVGDSFALTATVAPSNATNKNVTWTSSDESVATVSADGTVTAKSTGIATITVKTADGNKTATCVVTVGLAYDPDVLAFTVSSEKAVAGKTVKVGVLLSNNPGIAGFVLEIGYDSSVMKLTGYECTGWEANASNYDQNPDNNPVGFSWTRTTDYKANNQILTLTFEIKADAPEGEYNIALATPHDVVNQALEDVEFNLVGGKITVIDCVFGDSNGDGTIDIKDAVLLAQSLAGWSVSMNKTAADCNGDGKSDIKDAVLLAQYLAGWSVTLG